MFSCHQFGQEVSQDRGADWIYLSFFSPLLQLVVSYTRVIKAKPIQGKGRYVKPSWQALDRLWIRLGWMQPGLGWAAELSCQLQAPAYGSASCW